MLTAVILALVGLAVALALAWLILSGVLSMAFKRVRLNPLMAKERIIELRAAINAKVFLHERLGKYIQQLVAATRPYNPDTDWMVHSLSPLHWMNVAGRPLPNQSGSGVA